MGENTDWGCRSEDHGGFNYSRSIEALFKNIYLNNNNISP